MPSLLRFVACSCTAHLHGSMPHWLSIRRVGGRADAEERGPVPLSDASEDLTDLALDEDSTSSRASQNSSAHGQDDGDSDSDEHGGSDSAGKTALNGATSLVSMFGTGWLSSTVFNVLYKRVANRPVYLDKASLTAVNNFKRALCKTRGKDAYEWNQQLSANLEQLAEERQHDAEHHERLTDSAALQCCWRWMHNFKFTPEQRKLPNRRKRSIFNTIMHRELGCLRRAQAVVKFGTAGLADNIIAQGEEAVLACFIAYIRRIEKEVHEKRQRSRDLESRQRTFRSVAQERAHSPLIRAYRPQQPAKGTPLIRAWNKHGTHRARSRSPLDKH